MGPRILLIGGTYRALCVLERLLERGERVVGFLGQEGDGERDFCAEILEACERASIPARSGRKLGEEMVRWLEDRIRPELAIAVGLSSEIPVALGGNCRLGLIEMTDLFQSEACPGVVLRQRGQDVVVKRVDRPKGAAERDDVFLEVVDAMLRALDEYLDQRRDSRFRGRRGVRFDPAPLPIEDLDRIVASPDSGPETDALEAEVADYLGAEHVLAVRSAEEGLRALLRTIGIREGHEVMVPAIASAWVPEAVRALGATPARADVEPGRLTLDCARLSEALSPQTRAVVVSHALGQPAAIDRLYAWAEDQGLEVLEDGAEAFGARFGDSRLGRSPCSCVFRFPPHGGRSGPAAAFVTIPGAMAGRVGRILRAQRIGDGLAGVCRRVLGRWEDALSRRREIAAEYSSALVRYDAFRLPATHGEALSVYPAFLLRLTRFARTGADDLEKLLGESGIEVRRLAPPASERDLARLPVAEEAVSRGLLLPLRLDLTRDEQELTLDAIFDFAIG